VDETDTELLEQLLIIDGRSKRLEELAGTAATAGRLREAWLRADAWLARDQVASSVSSNTILPSRVPLPYSHLDNRRATFLARLEYELEDVLGVAHEVSLFGED